MTNACGIAIISNDDARNAGLVVTQKKILDETATRGETTIKDRTIRKNVQSLLDERVRPFMNDTPGSLFPKLDGILVGSAFGHLDCSIAWDNVAIQKKELEKELKTKEKERMASIGNYIPNGILDKAGSFLALDDVCVNVFKPDYHRVCDEFEVQRFNDFKNEVLPRVESVDWLIAFTFHK